MDDIIKEDIESACRDEATNAANDLEQALKDARAGRAPQAPRGHNERTDQAAVARHQYQLMTKRWRTFFAMIEHFRLTNDQGHAMFNVVARHTENDNSECTSSAGDKRRR